jgi:hypothetical protein
MTEPLQNIPKGQHFTLHSLANDGEHRDMIVRWLVLTWNRENNVPFLTARCDFLSILLHRVPVIYTHTLARALGTL